LKEQLIKKLKLNSFGNAHSQQQVLKKNNNSSGKNDSLNNRNEILPLTSLKSKNSKYLTGLKEMKQYQSDPSILSQRVETFEYQYMSPKARQQMNSEVVPILMSNVFLTGTINPTVFSNHEEATIEYIINEHHAKTQNQGDWNIFKNDSLEGKAEKRKLDKISVAMTLSRQDKKIKEGELNINNTNKKVGIDKVGMKLRATVGHLRMERELKRKKVLNLLRTKNFNLFRTNTINNLHLLKDAL